MSLVSESCNLHRSDWIMDAIGVTPARYITLPLILYILILNKASYITQKFTRYT